MKPPATIFHFSYHKCLTVYFMRVMKRALVTLGPHGMTTTFRHLNSRAEWLNQARSDYVMVSLNNSLPDLESLGDAKMSRFMRDPRDLLVSGYFYHRRGAEPWCNLRSPTAADWRMVNGTVPTAMPIGMSFAEYLKSQDVEAGLLAELEFRRRHFESMAAWPDEDERLLVFDYSEIIGNEEAVYRRLMDHYRLPKIRRIVGMHAVRQFSAATASRKTDHVRNPRPGQWRQVLTPTVLEALEKQHPTLLDAYDRQFAKRTRVG
ncbi:sulfotransferase domain-containing protein [Myceligenerans salitolerans]|uniref:Sulfotransferase domain-containing protein n=1 Tax=Myceligenerans salitolerans TaxID=1230528 RepID=A0ABS3IDB4_9MICO|nr:sulfotransferase domain-containing protein [Myceligenerans salitolerans]MBO0610925.1 sulfotransferase domain-containing protein [Myceligenerans salitolerans]